MLHLPYTLCHSQYIHNCLDEGQQPLQHVCCCPLPPQRLTPDFVLCAKQTLLGVSLSWCDHLSHQLKLPSLCLPHGLLKLMSEDTHC